MDDPKLIPCPECGGTGKIPLRLGACLSNSGFFWPEKGESDSVLAHSKTFRAWKIDEPLLLPPVVADFVAEDHLARFVVSLVRDEIDLIEISAS
jgi:hypothetical protein